MRTMEQCKAEVFRRSEEIIRKRKVVRRCVIAACLPLCLFVGMWSVLILPAMMPAKAENAADFAPPMEMVQDSITHYENPTAGATKPVTASIAVTGAKYFLSAEDAATVLEILKGLEYNPAKLCKCLPQFRVVTQTEDYGVHLSEGYARCDAGQAKLTQEQIDIIREIYGRTVPEN